MEDLNSIDKNMVQC